jgi:uncharacterized RDD family membrane protein YckC
MTVVSVVTAIFTPAVGKIIFFLILLEIYQLNCNFHKTTQVLFIFFFKIFLKLLLLYWGYIVTFTKTLTIDHSQIYPLHHYPLFSELIFSFKLY